MEEPVPLLRLTVTAFDTATGNKIKKSYWNVGREKLFPEGFAK